MNSSPRRAVITGIGLVSPLGLSKEAFAEALATGKSGVGPLTSLPAGGLPLRYAAEASQFTGDIENFGPLDKEQKKAIRKGSKLMCRECQMGVAAAQISLADAGLNQPGKIDPERIGVSYGSDYMLSIPEEFTEGIQKCLDAEGVFDFSRWGTDGLSKMSPLWLLKYLPNMPGSHIAIYNDFRGPNNSMTMREASANLTLGEAMQIILRNSAEVMLCGCTGTRLHAMKAIHAVQLEELADVNLSPEKASRPFDAGRTGMVLGEGAGSIILEELETAKKRGATIYGEVIAASSSSVADRHLVARRDQALINVLEGVLRSSGLKPDDIGHINAHGLSTKTCDIDEAKAIQHVFGSRSKPIPVTAAKSYFGNLGAGGGMIETIAGLIALQENKLFATLNYETADAECPLAVVKDRTQEPGKNFIKLSVTPQGQASAVLIAKYEQEGTGIGGQGSGDRR